MVAVLMWYWNGIGRNWVGTGCGGWVFHWGGIGLGLGPNAFRIALAFGRNWLDIELALGFNLIGMDGFRIGVGFELGQNWIGIGLVSDSRWIVIGLVWYWYAIDMV